MLVEFLELGRIQMAAILFRFVNFIDFVFGHLSFLHIILMRRGALE